MSWRSYIFLFLLGLVGPLIMVLFQRSPGYMDADYYFAGGIRLAQGDGFSEKILWNYLDDPAGIPHPSHGYWMPLVSVLSAGGMRLTGQESFPAARLPFQLCAAFIPPLTAGLALKLYNRKDLAILAGFLAALPAFYIPYLSTSDVFGPYMVLGLFYFLLLPSSGSDHGSNFRFSLLGLVAGLMHLSRADGVIWIVAALLSVFILTWKNLDLRVLTRSIFSITAGYLVVMGPWFYRNTVAFGSPLSPGGSRALWILNYDELFIFPASQLTFLRWWNSGMRAIVSARAWAAGQNIQSAIAVQGEIFLAPLIMIGMWQLRKDLRIRLAGLGWGLTFLVMTLIFPYQGARGGFFHSGAAIQPVFWALAPLGFDAALKWGARWRGWQIHSARIFFGAGLVGLTLLMTGFVTYNRLFSSQNGRLGWNESFDRYTQLEKYLISVGASTDQIVMVNNSPGYYVASGRPAISIPNGDLKALCSAGQRYRAAYLLLEIDQILGGSELFNHPKDQLCLQYIDTVEDVRLFKITRE